MLFTAPCCEAGLLSNVQIYDDLTTNSSNPSVLVLPAPTKQRKDKATSLVNNSKCIVHLTGISLIKVDVWWIYDLSELLLVSLKDHTLRFSFGWGLITFLTLSVLRYEESSLILHRV